jgi:hypothetical protein
MLVARNPFRVDGGSPARVNAGRCLQGIGSLERSEYFASDAFVVAFRFGLCHSVGHAAVRPIWLMLCARRFVGPSSQQRMTTRLSN